MPHDKFHYTALLILQQYLKFYAGKNYKVSIILLLKTIVPALLIKFLKYI